MHRLLGAALPRAPDLLLSESPVCALSIWLHTTTWHPGRCCEDPIWGRIDSRIRLTVAPFPVRATDAPHLARGMLCIDIDPSPQPPLRIGALDFWACPSSVVTPERLGLKKQSVAAAAVMVVDILPPSTASRPYQPYLTPSRRFQLYTEHDPRAEHPHRLEEQQQQQQQKRARQRHQRLQQVNEQCVDTRSQPMRCLDVCVSASAYYKRRPRVLCECVDKPMSIVPDMR